LNNLFRLRSLQAKDIMTPRTVIQALQEDQSVDQALAIDTPFSRLPLFEKDRDDIHGFVLRGDILLAKARGEGDILLHTLKRPITTVHANTPLSSLMESLLDQRQHLALVVSEYGGTEGLVTLEDLVETLIGKEIVDEMDTVEDMQALARQRWTQRAKALGLNVDAAAETAGIKTAQADQSAPQ
jgi:CBS domain containing-hemolysin-like protein